MKITYLHQYFNTPDMSGGTRSFEMARRMVAAGHDVHMITSNRSHTSIKSEWTTSIESGITVHWFPVPYSNHMSYIERVWAFISFAKAARKKALEQKADVIFASSTPLTIALPGVGAARKLQVPLVFEVRDLWPELPIAIGALTNPFLRFLAKRLERWAYKNSSIIVALSPGMKEGVIKQGVPSNRIAVIPNSSDNNEFSFCENKRAEFRKKRPWLGDRRLLVYGGTFGKINGVSYMVELAQELKALGSEIRILLVGDGYERDSVLDEAKQAGVFQVNLFIEKEVPKKEIPYLLAAADMAATLFIDLPEMRANSANKFFDALASSTPVFLNYGGWMHDLTVQHKCGLAMWHKPITEVAKQLDIYMNEAARLKQDGISARRLAEKVFDRDRLAEQLIQVLQCAVDRKTECAELVAPGDYNGCL